MTVTAASFRVDFPAFANVGSYPDALINFWISVALLMMDANRWGNLLDLGTELFVAHNLVLEVQSIAAAANGSPPGLITGVISAKSVDKVSISYDVGAGIEEGAGHWNLSTYGTRYLSIRKMVGAGPIQLGIGSSPPFSGMAWPGPDTYPGWFS